MNYRYNFRCAYIDQQMNQITAYLDASNMYGSSLSTQQSLRTFSGGMLQAQNIRGKQLLPGNPSECSDDTGRAACFRAGMCCTDIFSKIS